MLHCDYRLYVSVRLNKKASIRVEFLLSVIELLFLSLAVEALQGKMCQNSLPSGGVDHLEPRFQGEGVAPC